MLSAMASYWRLRQPIMLAESITKHVALFPNKSDFSIRRQNGCVIPLTVEK
jgi:hypothetical protein